MDSKILKSPIPTLPYPKDVNLVKYMIDNLSLYDGDKEVMVDCPSGRTWSAKQVIDHILDVAAAFISRGLKKGDVVCFVSPNSDYYAMILFGVIAAGGKFTAYTDQCPLREVSDTVEDTGASFMVTDLTNIEVVKSVGQKFDAQIKEIFVITDNEFKDDGKLVSCDKLFHHERSKSEINVPVQVKSSDLAALILSSGSTGRPKPIMITHSNLINLTAQFRHEENMSYSDKSVQSCHNPFCHGGGLLFITHSLSAGAKAAVMPGFGNERYFVYTQKYKITSAFLVPQHIIYLVNCDVSSYDLTSLEDVICSGSPLPSGYSQKAVEKLGLKYFRQAYGMTEVSFCTMPWRSKWKEQMDSLGWCAPDNQIKIVDPESGKIQGPNQVGEVLIKSLKVTPGYLNLPEENAKLFDDEGFLRTGDAGYYDDNKLLYIVERYKHIIKVESIVVLPSELESLLLNHEAISEAAVVGIKHEYYGEIPKAFVVLKEGHKNVKPDDIIKYIKDQVAVHKQLRGGVEIMNELPKSALGKVNKKLLLK